MKLEQRRIKLAVGAMASFVFFAALSSLWRTGRVEFDSQDLVVVIFVGIAWYFVGPRILQGREP